MNGEFDYRLKFLKTGLADALAALQALRDAGILEGESLPTNMLGEFRDDTGAETDADAATWRGSPGRTVPVIDDDGEPTGATQEIGDPLFYYVAIRSTTPPSDIPFDLGRFGLETCSDSESAAVLGQWE